MVKDLLLIIFTISLINCLNLRELKLERDKEKYDALVKVAKQTVYQLYNKTIDFNDRNDAYIQKKDVMTIKVVIDEYTDTRPNYTNQTSFTIVNGKPVLPDLEIPKDASFDVYGAKDLKEEFIAFGNMIAAGYEGFNYGEVYIYRKETTYTAQGRFKCFVKSKNGTEYGAFEILQEDINDRKDLKDKIENFLRKVGEILSYVSTKVKIVAEFVGSFRGIYKDLNNLVNYANSLNKIPYLSLISLFILF